MKKSVRYAIINPRTKAVGLDFGSHKDLLELHIKRHEEAYGSKSAGTVPAKITTLVMIEDVNTPDTETAVGITLLHGSSLVLTSDNNIAVHDRENDLYISVGPATVSTLNAIIDAAERLKVHAK